MADYGRPFVGGIKTVEDDWIDYNGHFNMAYYGVLFDRTCDEAFELVGLGPEYLKSGASFFTLETHTTYIRELHADYKVKVTLQMLDYDAKRMHYVQEMFHADEGWLSATMEAICMHVDMTAKKSAPFPESILDRISAMHEAHAGLPVPPQVGHKIGIIRK
ncbi:MAG: thioesterase family protein [Anderseniella sp.]